MRQIAIQLGGADIYDLPIDTDTEHLAIDETEATAVLIALTTERRATADQAPDAADRGGWWGETDLADRPFGSLLWTLKGRGRTPDTLTLAESYARDALVRWTDAGYDVEVSASYAEHSALEMSVRLARADSVLVVAVPVVV